VGAEDIPRGEAAHHRRAYAVYRLFSAAFIEMDVGDARFLQSFSRWLFGPNSEVMLTISHFWALVHLGVPGGRAMVELAQLLLCDKSNVTAIVDKLEERGWATRVRGKAGDRRFTSVVLTAEGERVRELVVRAHAEWVNTRFAGLTEAQLSQIAALLDVLRPGLQTDPDMIAEAAAQRLGLATTSAAVSLTALLQRRPVTTGDGAAPGHDGHV
jgi:DNA-binding MarR family transcriptional regulator